MAITEKNYEGVNYCLRCGNELTFRNDRESKLRPYCKKCGWTYYKNPTPASTCVILNEHNEIVIIRRKFAPQAGAWALPSGYVEIDQDPEKAAIDEMKEETGLTGMVKESLGYLQEYSPICEQVISFGFLMQVVGGELQAGDDAAEALYVPLKDLPELAFPSHRFFVKKIKEIIEQNNK